MKLGDQLWSVALEPADKVGVFGRQVEFQLPSVPTGSDGGRAYAWKRKGRGVAGGGLWRAVNALCSRQNGKKRTVRYLVR